MAILKKKKSSVSLYFFAPLVLLLFNFFPVHFFPVQPVSAEPEVCGQIRSLLPSVSILRNLPIKNQPGCEVLPRDKFLQKRRELYADELTPERLKWEAVYQRALGLIPIEYNYERCVLEGASEDVVAFYDPASKAILIPEGDPPTKDVLVHELVHVLQDQEFKLSRLENIARQSTDASLAIGALVEGDAVLVQKLFLANEQKRSSPDLEPSSTVSPCYPPPLLLEQYEFPYYFGELFALRLYEATKSFKKINEALQTPPTTSHDIIHRQVTTTDIRDGEIVPAPLPEIFSKEAYSAEFTDSLGQFTTRLVLSQSVNQPAAIRAAKGWKSDRLTVYREHAKKRAVVAWHTVWATLQDSEEFYQGIKILLESRFGVSINDDAHQAMGTLENEPTFLLRSRGRVVELFLVQLLS